MLGAVIGLADPVGVEAVGGEDVGAGIRKRLRDAADDVRAGQVEKVIIALLVAGEVEPAAIIGFLQAMRLDLGPVGAILDEDALRRFGTESCRRGHAAAFARAPSK